MSIPKLDTPIQTLICMIVSQRYNSYQLILISFKGSGIFHFSSEIPWSDTPTVPNSTRVFQVLLTNKLYRKFRKSTNLEANTSWNQSIIKLTRINKICISDAENWRRLPKFAFQTHKNDKDCQNLHFRRRKLALIA